MTPHTRTLRRGARRLQTVSLLALLVTLPAYGQQANTSPTQTETPEAARAAAEKKAAIDAANKGTAPAAPAGDDVIKLSPFTVTTDKDQGYFAENTLAGSRLNSNLSDLAASITVVTKQQLDDTASLDINDVFKYEANTEGSNTYSPVVTDRGTMKDTVAGYSLGNDGATTTNSQSNRVRGLSAPDTSMNYYPTNNRIPFDSYNTQSVEISRGPNSLLFGLGSPAGIVNQSVSPALLNRDTNTVSLRTDHNGSYRGSISFNRGLIDDKLAVYMAFLYDNRQFERKPSFELTRRQYAAMTYKPFKKTVLRAFAENFTNRANRPNSLTPRDFVTPWLEAGRPVYDPLTRRVTVLNTGAVTGPYVFSTLSPGYVAGMLANASNLTSTTSSQYVPGITYDNVSRPVMRVDGTIIDYFQRQPTLARTAFTNPAQTAPTPANQGWVAGDARYAILDRQWTMSTAYNIPTVTRDGVTYTQGNYQYAGVTNQSIYDWTEYNTNQANFGALRSGNYNIEFEQQILDNLFFSAGWFRQDIDSSANYTVSQLTGATLAIDTNVNLPTGAANKYVGLPFIMDYTPDTFFAPETDDNYRAMLAYDLDLTQNNGWTRWLGKHRLLAMWSDQRVDAKTERWRMNFASVGGAGQFRYMNNPLLGAYNMWNNGSGYLQRNYYMARPGDPQATVTQSTGYIGNPGWDAPYSTNVQVYNYTTGQVESYPVQLQTFFSEAGSFSSQRQVESFNYAIQSYLWNNRLVTTLGLRSDDYRARRTSTGALQNPDGTQAAAALTNAQLWDAVTGITNRDLVMNRWNRWDELSGDTKTLGAAFRPFSGWNSIENRANNGSALADFARGLTLYYNKSDNFNPPSSYQTDIFFKTLPKPTGEGTDIGVGFNLFNNKLVARVNWFETENQNERTNAASTLLTRLLYGDTTLMYNWAATVVRIRSGANPQTTNWNSDPLTDAQINQVWDLMKLPRDYYSGLSAGATQQSKAKGVELQVTYNPVRNWTMKFTAAKQETTYTQVAPEYDAWYAVRKPVWDAAVAPDIADFTDVNGTQYSLRNFWTSYGYNSAARLSNTDGNTNAQNYFANTVLSQVALAKALEGVVSPNQRKYRGSFLTNYSFTSGRLKGVSVGGSERWESKAAVGYLGKAADPTRPTVLTAADPTKPVYLDNGNWYTDLWISYSRKIWNDKVRMKVQLNVNNAFEGGRLLPIAVNYDGKPWAYRIIDPRQFVLTTTFDF